MSFLYFNLNRPVHVARRNVFYERAVELIHTPTADLDAPQRGVHLEAIIDLLETAERHGRFAMLSAHDSMEPTFQRFVQMMLDSMRSVHAMVAHQIQMESAESFLSDFLETSQEDALLPAMHYQRRAADILQGVWHVLRLAHQPYQALQQRNVEAFTKIETERYERALASFRTEVRDKYPSPRAEPASDTA